MKELLERVHTVVSAHLENICDDMERDEGFRNRQQVDDVKDCVKILKVVRDMLSLSIVK